MSSVMTIGSRRVGPGHPCFVTAEVAQAHDGSLGAAHAFIDAVARTGADAVKFQTHLAAYESTPSEPFRVEAWPQDASRYDYWIRTEFTERQWLDLAAHASDRDLMFLSSPFSLAAAELLERVGVPAWKIASGEVSNLPLLRYLADTRKPVLLSSGLSTWQELDRAVRLVRDVGSEVAVYQCTSAYPCSPERLGLNMLVEMEERYNCPVGLSDHSATIAAGLAAVVLGANLVEVHVTMSREAFGPDVQASLTLDELRQLVGGVRFVETALSHPIDKDDAAAQVDDLRRIFQKSVVASHDLTVGLRLQATDLCAKKPGTGIPAARLEDLVGRRVRKVVRADSLVEEADLE